MVLLHQSMCALDSMLLILLFGTTTTHLPSKLLAMQTFIDGSKLVAFETVHKTHKAHFTWCVITNTANPSTGQVQEAGSPTQGEASTTEQVRHSISVSNMLTRVACCCMG